MVKMLRVEGINTFYGRTHILKNVSLFVEEGKVVCLLGRHGSGKTTILKVINASRTSILMAEQNIRFATSLASKGYLIDRGRIRLNADKWEGLKSPFA